MRQRLREGLGAAGSSPARLDATIARGRCLCAMAAFGWSIAAAPWGGKFRGLQWTVRNGSGAGEQVAADLAPP